MNINLLFEQVSEEQKQIEIFNNKLLTLDEKKRKSCTIRPTDTPAQIRRKCRQANTWGVYHAPLWGRYTQQEPTSQDTSTDAGDTGTDTGGDVGGGDGGGVGEVRRIPRKPGQPVGSKKHSDLYTDENPKGTIHGLKFATVDDAKASVSKIRRSGRSHAHKIQAAIAMEQRAKAAGKTSAAAVYRSYINSMKKKTDEVKPQNKDNAFAYPYSAGPENDYQLKPQDEAMSSTERVRKYYKRHPEKVRNYLKKTQDDRVARNRDRKKAVEKYGEKKMKNHDVHHPNGAQNGNWKLAKKDHGRDKNT